MNDVIKDLLAHDAGLTMSYRHHFLDAYQVERLKDEVRTQEQREALQLHWGTYGPLGKTPFARRPIDDLDTDHLQAILITQGQASIVIKAAIVCILEERGNNACY